MMEATRPQAAFRRRELRGLARDVMPPLLWRALAGLYRIAQARGRRGARAMEWEYVPAGWQEARRNPAIKGWNVEAVLEAQRTRWPAWVRSLEGAAPLALSPEAVLPSPPDPAFHNTIMSYAYALTLATRQQSSARILDWGGGIGHYYLLSRALLPELSIEYHCKEVPLLAEHGRQLFPEAHFHTDESCLSGRYDFVFVSSSLHYSQDWVATLEGLARATTGYLFVTRLPIVQTAASFVFVQRPYRYGYDTEYLGWCINRDELLQATDRMGLQLIREFIIAEAPAIHRAPEPSEYRGYLFRRQG